MNQKYKITSFLIFLGILWPLAAQDAPGPQIIGRVVNGTFEDRPVAGQEVLLLKISEGNAEDIRRSVTDDEGNYAFRDLSPESEITYVVSIIYLSIDHFSDQISLQAESGSAEAILRVYETSSNAEALQVKNHHLIVEEIDGGVYVQEVIFLLNNAPYTYIGDANPNLKFALPPEAVDFGMGRLLEGENAELRDNIVLISAPILPEGRMITYNYIIPVEGDNYLLKKTIEYPTGRLDVFLSLPATALTSELKPAEPLVLEGMRYQRLSGLELPAGIEVAMKISLAAGRGGSSFPVFLLIAALVFLIAALAYPFLKKGTGVAVDKRELLVEEKDRLIGEIARLDEEFESRGGDNGRYRALRQEKKRRLLVMLRETS